MNLGSLSGRGGSGLFSLACILQVLALNCQCRRAKGVPRPQANYIYVFTGYTFCANTNPTSWHFLPRLFYPSFARCDSPHQALTCQPLPLSTRHKASLPLSLWTIDWISQSSPQLALSGAYQTPFLCSLPCWVPQLLTTGSTKVTLTSGAKWGVGVRKYASFCVLHAVEEYQRSNSLLPLQRLPRHEFMGKSSQGTHRSNRHRVISNSLLPSTAKIWYYTKLFLLLGWITS